MKNILKIALSILTIFTTNLLFADGIPVDSNGNIKGQHFTLRLTKSQQIYLESHREIILTKEQKRYFHPSLAIETLTILDPHYHDCTCGMFYGIWTAPDEFALFGDSVDYSNPSTNIEPIDEHLQDLLDEASCYVPNERNHLYIGVAGELYYDNKHISFAEFTAIRDRLLKEQEDRYLVIYVAPKKNNPTWNAVERTKKSILKEVVHGLEVYWM